MPCNFGDDAQRWFVKDVFDNATPLKLVHPLHRPFTCLLVSEGPDGNSTSGFYPCPGCSVGSEETVDLCEGIAPTFDEILWNPDDVPEGALFIPIANGNQSIGVAAFPNGSCMVDYSTGPAGLWDDCRTECIRDIPASFCNDTAVQPVGGILHACGNDGSVAAISQSACTSDGTIDQPPFGSGATAVCSHGFYRISSHGRGYVSGQASINGAPVTIYTSQAVIQPYDEAAAVSGFGVDVFNISQVTALFGLAFERSLYPSNKSTSLYISVAIAAFSVGIIFIVMAMIKVVHRNRRRFVRFEARS